MSEIYSALFKELILRLLLALAIEKKCPICWLALSQAAVLSTAYGAKKTMLSTNENHFVQAPHFVEGDILGNTYVGKMVNVPQSQSS